MAKPMGEAALIKAAYAIEQLMGLSIKPFAEV
jgi:hypothetical protein